MLLAGSLALAGDYKCKSSTQDCLDAMANKMKSAGWVGIEYDPEGPDGAPVVKVVVPGSPAAAAGLEPGDVLYAVNGVRFASGNEDALGKVRKEWKPGQSVTYAVRRNGADRDVALTLAPMPADVLAKWIGQHMLEHARTDVATTKH
jgi:S1-C subfamily serine protease